eukprot:jgi/Picsp_1/1787/NSC_05258-R1_duf323 domain protein
MCPHSDETRPGDDDPDKGSNALHSSDLDKYIVNDEVDDADLRQGLIKNPKEVPVRFLYDDLGSKLYQQITGLGEYYLYDEELGIFKEHAKAIVRYVSPGAALIELGLGDASKTVHLLRALIDRDGADNVNFIGIDVSGEALRLAKKNILLAIPELSADKICMIEMEYLDGLQEAKTLYPNTPLFALWLGSSIGNFTREDSVYFLRQVGVAMGEDCFVLLCTDLWKEQSILQNAYDDSMGITKQFIMNGMTNVLKHRKHYLSHENPESLWQYEVVVNDKMHQVEMWLTAKKEIQNIIDGVDIKKGERLLMEVSKKFTQDSLRSLAFGSGFTMQDIWATSKYQVQLLAPALMALWKTWEDTDALFHQIANWDAQPIDLRHSLSFYYGHCMAFANLRLLPEKLHTTVDKMYSRGIDPDVQNPEVCHDHPPYDPSKLLGKSDLLNYIDSSRRSIEASVREKLHMHRLRMVLEHERMHQETLCYMLAQLRKQSGDDAFCTLPSSSTAFYFNYVEYGRFSLQKTEKIDICKIRVPTTSVQLGIRDIASVQDFCWDNEFGSHLVEVKSFVIAPSPVTVKEFLEFMDNGGYKNHAFWNEDFDFFQAHGQQMPATWSRSKDGSYSIHMPEKTYPLDQVAHCPVYVSLVEARAYAAWKSCRIMTEQEYCAAFQFTKKHQKDAGLNEGGWEWTSTAFKPFQGFTPDPLYPEYSSDFFDGVHFILKGSSPYTHPSIRRNSFRNFFQDKYPFVFAKFRLVFD